jgi:phosphoserine phosphatase
MEKWIYVLRHGETDYNRLGIVQGQGVDTSLNELGRQQAQAFYEHYAAEPFELLLTSSLQRTHQTIAPFLERGLPWKQVPEINEISWGKHEGQRSTPEMRDEFLHTLGQWKLGNLHARFSNGESAADLAARLGAFVQQLPHYPAQKILVCSHGRAMRCLTCLLLGEPVERMEEFHHANTGLYLFHYREGRFELKLQNDTRHLEAAGLKID